MNIRQGFTLVELMVSVLITSVIAAIALPSLSNWYQASRANANIEALASLAKLARNHAVSYGVRVTICPLASGKCSNDWRAELTAFTDQGSTNELDGTDVILSRLPAVEDGDSRNYSRTSLRFLSDGLASGANGTLKFCPQKPDSPFAKALIINNAGRIRKSSEFANCNN
ncbi:GspH/FimT family pseudopilin [Shewanella cyperi]|uniref:GspH/FimT family pseudopilin n=1 Tax=Shewanella cyperi TaxID=2814292 RepID=UPI001A94C9D8|nr:GspH/FimT family pseudopilin [Shewanella cyperi]QSX41653.1 GspH/FimT family pseudopilin [Shewanella cyperi]